MTKEFLPTITEQSGLAGYLAKIKKIPMLEQEEEFNLAKAMIENHDIKAAEKLVSSHLKLVVKIAGQYKGYGLPLVEMISEGNIGLMLAVKKFNPDMGFRLATYATWWIKAQMQEYVLKSWSLVKIGTTSAQKKLFFNLRKMKAKIFTLENRSLNNEDIKQIAHILNVNESDVSEMEGRMGNQDLSLNRMVGEDQNEEVINFLPETRPNQEALTISKHDLIYKQKIFKQALAELDARELKVIEERYLSSEPATLDKLSIMFNVSRERVRQLEERAINKLKKYISNNYKI